MAFLIFLCLFPLLFRLTSLLFPLPAPPFSPFQVPYLLALLPFPIRIYYHVSSLPFNCFLLLCPFSSFTPPPSGRCSKAPPHQATISSASPPGEFGESPRRPNPFCALPSDPRAGGRPYHPPSRNDTGRALPYPSPPICPLHPLIHPISPICLLDPETVLDEPNPRPSPPLPSASQSPRPPFLLPQPASRTSTFPSVPHNRPPSPYSGRLPRARRPLVRSLNDVLICNVACEIPFGGGRSSCV